MELLISVIKLWIWQKFNYKEDPAWYPESLATRACWRQGFFARAPSRNLDMEQSRAAWNSVRERLNTSPPKDNDDILENHISDQQETLEVKVTAPILARLHFLTINVFGSCQNWDQSGCRLPDKERRSKLGTILRPSNFRPKKEERNECRRKWVKTSPSVCSSYEFLPS